MRARPGPVEPAGPRRGRRAPAGTARCGRRENAVASAGTRLCAPPMAVKLSSCRPAAAPGVSSSISDDPRGRHRVREFRTTGRQHCVGGLGRRTIALDHARSGRDSGSWAVVQHATCSIRSSHPARAVLASVAVDKVFTSLAVSVDGFITGHDAGPGHGLGDGGILFGWYGNSDARASCSRLPAVRAEPLRLRRPREASRRRGRGPEHVRRLRRLRRGGAAPDGSAHRGQPPPGATRGDGQAIFVTSIKAGIESARAVAGDRDVATAAALANYLAHGNNQMSG